MTTVECCFCEKELDIIKAITRCRAMVSKDYYLCYTCWLELEIEYEES